MKHNRGTGLVVTVQASSIVKAFIAFLLFLFLVFSLSGLMTSLKPEFRLTSSSVNNVATNMTGEWLYHLMGSENHYFLGALPVTSQSPKLTNILFKMSANINLDDPRSLLGRELPGFSLFDGKIVVAGEGTNYTNMPMESAPPVEVLKAEQEASLQNTEGIDGTGNSGGSSPPPLTTGNRKVMYLYFTHNRESYLPYLKGVTDPDKAYHSQINVMNIGDKMKEQLESRGIGTAVEKADIQANLNRKGLDYTKSYQESRPVVQAAMASNRDYTYFIDIHRDSHRREMTTKVINGQSYAKLAFIIGGNQSNYEKNLKLATELHNLLDKKYPGLSRGVIVKREGNGKYNQDLSQNAILIEFGGVDNTFEELYRSSDALADVFSEYYWQAEKVNQNTNQPTNQN
ncbi:stage II sporulation protein P [Bacillus sp. 1NLA3E]|uniref:stage II sporulation protein P n=1 Tax=Bacillus sp. 1NLA3E TaxID=666686 RepID=UPI000247F05E|nr:stage II sporulation protein P [Bacillus sp. 1NLA3E]AGK54986.1 stage II sporulation protein P [Bacillus sp. 1NLA3E]